MHLLFLLLIASFDGNKQMSDAQIQAAIQPAGNRDDAENAILDLYWDNGFPLVRVGADGSGAIHIDEGTRYRIGTVTMRGFSHAAQSLVATRPGMWWNRTAIANDRLRLITTHPAGIVLPLTKIHADTRTIDLTFEWQPA